MLRLVLLVALGFGVGLLFGIVTEEPELLAGHLRGESDSVPLEEASALAADDSEARGGEDWAGAAPMRPVVAADERAALADLPRVAAREKEAAEEAARRRARTVGASSAAPPVPAAREVDVAVSAPLDRKVPASALASGLTQQDRSVPPPASPASLGKRDSAAERAWAIQVGAFSEQGAAERLATTLRNKRYPVEVLPTSGRNDRFRVRVQPIAGESEARGMAEDLKENERLPTWVTPMEARSGS